MRNSQNEPWKRSIGSDWGWVGVVIERRVFACDNEVHEAPVTE